MLIRHLCRKIAHDERAVVTADYIVRNTGSLRIIEEKMHPFLRVALEVTRKLFQIIDRTVDDGRLPHPVDAGKDIHIRSQIPCDIVRSEEHTSELQSRQYLVCRLL